MKAEISSRLGKHDDLMKADITLSIHYLESALKAVKVTRQN